MQAQEINISKCYVGAPHEKCLVLVRCTKIAEYCDRGHREYEFHGMYLSFSFGSFSANEDMPFRPEYLLEEIPEDTFFKIKRIGGTEACRLIKELYDAAKMREAMNETDMDVRHYICD